MTAVELLASLHQRGFAVAVGDGDAIVLSPKARVTPELREAIKANKTDLLQLLRPESFDDPRGALKRLEKRFEGEEEVDLFLLVVVHRGDPEPPEDLETRLRAQAIAKGLRGRLCLVAHSSLEYDPWRAGDPWAPRGNGHDAHPEGVSPNSQNGKKYVTVP